jgi:hypothetical protein
MDKLLKFRAVIEDAGNEGAFVTIPFDVEQIFGKKRVKVKATIEGEIYRGSVVRMGGTSHILVVLREIRIKIGKTFGDEIEILLEEDTEPSEFLIPEDLRKALESDPTALAFFSKLAYSHQKVYVQWIEEARRDQTRQDRVARTVDMIKQGKNVH